MKNEINVNLSGCLVERTNIGSYEYINICTGETNKIDWSFIDWTFFKFNYNINNIPNYYGRFTYKRPY
jgi:hypothetical protein